MGAAKISIARPNLFGHYTVVQNPCLPVPRPQNQLQSTRYLANPELTRTRQNTRYKVLHISRHFFKTITTDNKSSPYFSHHGHFSCFILVLRSGDYVDSCYEEGESRTTIYFRQIQERHGLMLLNKRRKKETKIAVFRSRRDKELLQVIENGLHKFYSRITCYI